MSRLPRFPPSPGQAPASPSRPAADSVYCLSICGNSEGQTETFPLLPLLAREPQAGFSDARRCITSMPRDQPRPLLASALEMGKKKCNCNSPRYAFILLPGPKNYWAAPDLSSSLLSQAPPAPPQPGPADPTAPAWLHF